MSTAVLERNARMYNIPPSSIGLMPLGFGMGTDSMLVNQAYSEARVHFLTPISRQKFDPAARLQVLLRSWQQETSHQSAYEKIVSNAHYQSIIAMGPIAVPLLLRELRKRLLFLFPALHALTDANPVPPEHEGDIQAMTDDWISWGVEEGYLDGSD
jgi:hypothetical protein